MMSELLSNATISSNLTPSFSASTLIATTMSSFPPPLPRSTVTSMTTSFATNSSTVRTSIVTSMASLLQTNESDVSKSSLLLSFSSSSSSPFSNVSDEERRRYLEQLQADTMLGLLPTLIFLFIVAVFGLCGNTLVLVVYSRKPRQNATDVYFMAIALFDLNTNVLTIPGSIGKLFHYWDYENSAMCRFLGFCITYTTVTSLLTLLAIAVCRYKKICRRSKRQTSIKTARIVCAVIAFGSVLIATPTVVLSGLLTVPTPRSGVYGRQCSLDNAYLNTIWPIFHASFITIFFFIICSSIFVLYGLISRQARHYSKIHASLMAAKIPTAHTVLLNDNSDNKNSRQGKSKLGFIRKKIKYIITQDDSTNERGQQRGEAVEMERKSINHDKGLKRTMSQEKRDDYSMTTGYTSDNSLSTAGELNADSVVTTIDDGEISVDQNYFKNIGGTEISRSAAIYENDSDHETLSEHGTDQNGSSNDDSFYSKKGSLPRNHSQERSLRRKLTDTLTRAKKAVIKTGYESDDSDCDSSSHSVSTIHSVGDTNNTNKWKRKRGGKSYHGLKSRIKTKRPHGKVFTKATIMSIAISATLVIAFSPYVVITVCLFSSPTLFQDMSPVGFSLFHIFVRFFLINSATNAIIYGICDVRFREQCWEILKCRK